MIITSEHKDDLICNMLGYLLELKEMDDISERLSFFKDEIGLTDVDLEYYGLEI